MAKNFFLCVINLGVKDGCKYPSLKVNNTGRSNQSRNIYLKKKCLEIVQHLILL